MAFNLIIIKQAPYSGRTAHETLEAIMSLALFEVPHKVVFFGPALSWLLSNQNPSQQKSLEKQINALPMYGSEDIYYVTEHLNLFAGATLNNNAEPVAEAELAQWFKQAAQVEVF